MTLGSFLSTNCTVMGPLAGDFLKTARKLMIQRSLRSPVASSGLAGWEASHFCRASPSRLGMVSVDTQILPPWVLATSVLGSTLADSLAAFFGAALTLPAASNKAATNQIF